MRTGLIFGSVHTEVLVSAAIEAGNPAERDGVRRRVGHIDAFGRVRSAGPHYPHIDAAVAPPVARHTAIRAEADASSGRRLYIGEVEDKR